MTARLLLSLLAVVVAASARAELPLPLRAGERLTYRVSWAVVPGAGEIHITASEEIVDGVPRLALTTHTATRGLAKWLLPFEANGKSLFDLQTGKLVWLHEKSVTRRKDAEHSVTFDYETREAKYVSALEPEKSRAISMPPGDPTDLMTALLQTRHWNLKPGEKRDALVLFDDDFYELTLHALGYEKVKTPLGTFNTLVLQPRMDKTPPKGMFRRGSTVRVWIAQDDHRLPVKFEVEFKIGTGTATIEAHATSQQPTQ